MTMPNPGPDGPWQPKTHQGGGVVIGTAVYCGDYLTRDSRGRYGYTPNLHDGAVSARPLEGAS